VCRGVVPPRGVGSVHAAGERPRRDRGVAMAACSSLRCAGRISVTAAGSVASVQSRKRVAVTEPAAVIVAVHVSVVLAQASLLPQDRPGRHVRGQQQAFYWQGRWS